MAARATPPTAPSHGAWEMHASNCHISGRCMCGSANEHVHFPHSWTKWEEKQLEHSLVSDSTAVSVAVLLFFLWLVMFLGMFDALYCFEWFVLVDLF